MRPIKFRGKTLDGNRIIHGDLTHKFFEENTFINGEPVCFSTVAQLVGYDADGNEIYEGDKVWGVGGFVYPAEIFFDTDGSERYQIGDKLPEKLDSTQVE